MKIDSLHRFFILSSSAGHAFVTADLQFMGG